MNAQQELNLNYNANNPNPNLDKFVGTWKWEGNNKNFTIILKKQNIKIPPFNRNVTADIIYGFHQYIENNNIIENTLGNVNYQHGTKKTSVFGGLSSYGEINILTGNLRHNSKNKSVEFEIEYIDTTHIKLVSLKNGEGLRLRKAGTPPFDWSISLPQNIILTKQ